MNSLIRIVVSLALVETLISQDSFEEFLQQQQQAQQQAFEDEANEFQNYVAEVTAQYDAYEQQQAREFEEFKKAVEEKWHEFKYPSKKVYVDYDEDLDSRASVDFENGVIIIEIIVEEEEPEVQGKEVEEQKAEAEKAKADAEKARKEAERARAKAEKAKAEADEAKADAERAKAEAVKVKADAEKVRKEAERARTKAEKAKEKEAARIRPKEKTEEEAREKLVDKKLAKRISILMKIKTDDGKPLLQGQIADKTGKAVKESDAESFAAEAVKEKPVAMKTYKAKDGKKRTVYTVKVPMKSDHLNIRANQYKEEVLKQSKLFNIDPIIAFAVMETESAFNPKAKSHIPAYGLMQLVPRSGASDAYLYVYKKDKFVCTADYLYDPSNNVELGCAYLAMIRHKYFKSITDDERAYICVIPAYNTGIGNVAKTLTGDTKLKPASEKANSMSPEQLYYKLLNDLEHQEARDYLERVWTRKDKYRSFVN
jgi:membrane-bound lytic murein transglycosylase C